MTELCGPGRNMVWVPNKSNPTFPQIWGSQLWCRNWDFPLRWNMKSSREKSNWWFPQIWGAQWGTPQLWSGFLTLCEGKNTRKLVQKWIQMHGRANQSRNTTFEHFSLSWGLLKIPHQLTGGYGTRLSIRRQDPKNYSDTEMRALSNWTSCWCCLLIASGNEQLTIFPETLHIQSQGQGHAWIK